MKIAYIATGAAGMLCGTCIHDNTLASALQQLGHEAALIPTYTPIRTDEENVSLDKMFFGGINVYLQEKFSVFRRTPWFIDNLLNNRKLLSWLADFGSTTNARELGALTVSMLKGESGHQKKELDKLIVWLKKEFRPDIVQLNHTMLLGFARQIKMHLQVPVLCGAQGEDLFLDDLVEPFASQARNIMYERARDVDAVITTCRYYTDFMAAYLRLDLQKLHTVNLGIHLKDFAQSSSRKISKPFVIGYLARLCPEKGLHHLIEAFHELWKKYGDEGVRLRIAGFLAKKDMNYVSELREKIRARGMAGAVDFLGEIDRQGKIDFLQSIHVLSVPTVYQEPKGLPILEALASGVPVVQPAHGAFPEILEKTGGGLLVEPHAPGELALAFEKLLQNETLRLELGRKGRKAVHDEFGAEKMAQAMVNIYSQYLPARGPVTAEPVVAKR